VRRHTVANGSVLVSTEVPTPALWACLRYSESCWSTPNWWSGAGSNGRPSAFRPDISQVAADRASVLGCRRSLLLAVGRCRCCQMSWPGRSAPVAGGLQGYGLALRVRVWGRYCRMGRGRADGSGHADCASAGGGRGCRGRHAWFWCSWWPRDSSGPLAAA